VAHQCLSFPSMLAGLLRLRCPLRFPCLLGWVSRYLHASQVSPGVPSYVRSAFGSLAPTPARQRTGYHDPASVVKGSIFLKF
jgi:hypothetical protein